MEHVRIYQGNQIGGCVTVISSVYQGKIHRIMIDYGSSLPGSERKEDFSYPWEEEPVDAVFFTHYHGDHVGRLDQIPEYVPLYMGATARQVLINIEEALSGADSEFVQDTEIHRKRAERLKNDEMTHVFHWNGQYYDSVDLNGFHVEPYSVDHSAYDAYMFLVEMEDTLNDKNGKYRVLHTGDFRGHGRRGAKMLTLIEAYVRRFGTREVDDLIIEGTMMSRPGERVLSEPQMQLEAARYLRKHKYAFLICSSTNVDSLASFYQAAQMAAYPHARYMYVYSHYFMEQLKLYTKTAGQFSDVYRFEKIARLNRMQKELQNDIMPFPMTQQELMETYGFLAVIKPEEFCEKYIDLFVDAYKSHRITEMPVLIYSMWDGYVDPSHKARNEAWISFLKRQEEKGVRIKHLHTSGHATPGMLARVINAVNPKRAIYPMHTEEADAFYQLPLKEELKERIQKSPDWGK